MNLSESKKVLAVALLAAGLFVAACGGDDSKDASSAATDHNGHSAASVLTASDLRTSLNVVLAEHVSLAASATYAALGGRSDEFAAAAAALNDNSVQLADIVGAAYGPEARTAFLDGWRRHIGFFVDYTVGAAGKDSGKQAKAVADLKQYAQDVATLFNAANGLPRSAVVQIVESHAIGLIAVIDAQAAGDEVKAYDGLREAVGHMHTLADPLADATVKKFPEKFAAAQP